MSWIIEIKNIKATEEFLENVDDDFASTIEGDGASAHLAMNIRDMIEKEKMYTASIERKWIKHVQGHSDYWLKELPECICGAKDWKKEGIKIYCGSCNFVLFEGFPSGASELLDG